MIRRRTHPPRRSASRRGFSLIETSIAAAVLTFGVVGLMALQIIGTRGKAFASNMTTASLLAHDLGEQASRWSYTDTRMAVLSTVRTTNDSAVTAHWDMGRDISVSTGLQAQFGEKAGDANARTAAALGTGYMGVAAPPLFYRYWNVYGIDLANTGTAQGKLVQIIVRWHEPGLGMRQVASSTYVADPAALWQ